MIQYSTRMHTESSYSCIRIYVSIFVLINYQTSSCDKERVAHQLLVLAKRIIACGLRKIYRRDNGSDSGGNCAERTHGGTLGKRLLYSGNIEMGRGSVRCSFTR